MCPPRGITHGDLYAHNILVNPGGHSLLGDFGAASFFQLDETPQSQRLAQALQAIEVRAVGCLLEELLARSEVDESSTSAVNGLYELKAACLQAEPAQRLSLAHIQERLSHTQTQFTGPKSPIPS